MHGFNFDYSRFNKNYNLVMTAHLVKVVRTHARSILIPFFQKAAITYIENDNGKTYPILTRLAEQLIFGFNPDGLLEINCGEEAKVLALAFVKTLPDWQKECLAFYFCTDTKLREQMASERHDILHQDVLKKEWGKELGIVISQDIQNMVNDEDYLATSIVIELLHLHDIFSSEYPKSWDASSIAFANENFNSYTGTNIKLIPLPLDDFEYWEKIIEPSEDDEDAEEEEEEDKDDDKDDDDDLGWIARKWIDYIKEHNKPLYLELTHNGILEKVAQENQDRLFRKLDELMDSGIYRVEDAEEEVMKCLFPKGL